MKDGQPQLIPAEMMHEIVQSEPSRPDMFVIIAYMRGDWYLPRFAERWYSRAEDAIAAAQRFSDDAESPYRFFKVVRIPGSE